MAKFLTTSGTSYYLEQIIINASTQLVLVTPYLQLSPNFIERLRDADNKGIKIILVYRTNKLSNNEWNLLNELTNIEIFSCENLHAKCYQNDDSLIISSMNLYQYSQENNREMSVLIDRTEDKQIYEDAIQEIESIINSSIKDKSSGSVDKTENGREDSPIAQVKVDPKYNDMDNFHLPLLYELLSKKYSSVALDLTNDIANTDKIEVENFPLEGIDLSVEDRIFFSFEDQHQNTFWYDKKDLFFDKIPEAKIYVERNTIKFYWNERMDTTVSEQNLPIKANAYFEIINKVVDILKN